MVTTKGSDSMKIFAAIGILAGAVIAVIVAVRKIKK